MALDLEYHNDMLCLCPCHNMDIKDLLVEAAEMIATYHDGSRNPTKRDLVARLRKAAEEIK